MSKTSDFNANPPAEETTSMQSVDDAFHAYLNAPATKLDADEYMAKDLDGVTEGLLGSGNLNFLMMQAGQTNEAISARGGNEIFFADTPLFSPTLMERGNTALRAASNDSDYATDRPLDMPSLAADTESLNALSQSTAASLGGSSLASNNSGSGLPFTNNDAFTTSSGSSLTQPPPTNGTSGTSGTNGSNGINGLDGAGGGDTTIINNYDIDIDPPDNIFTTINNLTDNTTDIVNNTTDNLFTTINNTTNNITEIINNILDGEGLGPIGISLDAALDDLLNLDLDFINGDSVLNVLDETLDLAPALDPIQGLVGDILADLSLDVILNPFQYDASAGDFDIHIGTDLNLLGLDLGLPSIDIPLDPVEFLLGDIDIGLDLGNTLLNLPLLGGGGPDDTDLGLGSLEQTLGLAPVIGLVEGIVNPAEDLIGDFDILGNLHVDLLNLGNDSAGQDTDIVLPLDIDLVDSDLLNNGLSIALDPVEALVGDIDLDLTVAGDLLGNIADALIDGEHGGTGTDNLLSDVGDTVSGLARNVLNFDTDPTDHDLALDLDASLPGIPAEEALNVVLDPVEHLAGDIDVAADVGLNLFQQGDAFAESDTDLVVELGPIAGIIPGAEIPIELDLVESIVGDIDIHAGVGSELLADPLGTVGDLLDEGIPELVDGLLSGLDDGGLEGALGLLDTLPLNTGGLDLTSLLPEGGGGIGGGDSPLPSWTESLLPDAGDALGSGLVGGLADVLPDPISSLPALNIPSLPLPVLPVGGGLFGGNHGGGGLFG